MRKMHAVHLEPSFEKVVAFINPTSTNCEADNASAKSASLALAGTDDLTPISARVNAAHFQCHDPEDSTLYIIRGGDSILGGAMNAVLEASNAHSDITNGFSSLFPH